MVLMCKCSFFNGLRIFFVSKKNINKCLLSSGHNQILYMMFQMEKVFKF